MNINKWLELSLKDRLYIYKSSFAAGKYIRTKREVLRFCSEIFLNNKDSDVFLLSL